MQIGEQRRHHSPTASLVKKGVRVLRLDLRLGRLACVARCARVLYSCVLFIHLSLCLCGSEVLGRQEIILCRAFMERILWFIFVVLDLRRCLVWFDDLMVSWLLAIVMLLVCSLVTLSAHCELTCYSSIHLYLTSLPIYLFIYISIISFVVSFNSSFIIVRLLTRSMLSIHLSFIKSSVSIYLSCTCSFIYPLNFLCIFAIKFILHFYSFYFFSLNTTTWCATWEFINSTAWRGILVTY